MGNLKLWNEFEWPLQWKSWDLLPKQAFEGYFTPERLHRWVVSFPEEKRNEFFQVLIHHWMKGPSLTGADWLKTMSWLTSPFSVEGNLHQIKEEDARLFLNCLANAVPTHSKECIQEEYQFFLFSQRNDWFIYREARIQFLQQLGNQSIALAWLQTFTPKIGVYAGSFNPFHKGHLNILEKAEKVFDKVILAFGVNLDKDGQEDWPLPKTLHSRQIESYHGLLTTFISDLGYPVTLIRGLRNSTDFHYEQNQFRYLCELLPVIQVVNIFCDKEFEHISSSGIRTLSRFQAHLPYLVP